MLFSTNIFIWTAVSCNCSEGTTASQIPLSWDGKSYVQVGHGSHSTATGGVWVRCGMLVPVCAGWRRAQRSPGHRRGKGAWPAFLGSKASRHDVQTVRGGAALVRMSHSCSDNTEDAAVSAQHRHVLPNGCQPNFNSTSSASTTTSTTGQKHFIHPKLYEGGGRPFSLFGGITVRFAF